MILVLLLAGCASGTEPTDGETARRGATTSTVASSTSAPGSDLPAGRDVEVTSITDGDTFRAGDERVRLIGIDAPESSGDTECFAREATAALARLIPVGTDVRLVPDVEPVDRYGRTLAYVYRLPVGEDVNLAMVRDGYAQTLTVPPNVDRVDEFVAAAAEARRESRGLWSACPDDVGPTTTSTSPTTGTAGATTAPAGDCDPSYPDVCIPPPPPDLDCVDVPARDFRVVAPDPHHFDGGGDGIGCETDR